MRTWHIIATPSASIIVRFLEHQLHYSERFDCNVSSFRGFIVIEYFLHTPWGGGTPFSGLYR